MILNKTGFALRVAAATVPVVLATGSDPVVAGLEARLVVD